MSRTHQLLGSLAAAALLVVLGGCGGKDQGNDASQAPSDASTSAFCNVNKGLDANSTPKEVVAKFEQVGTPKDMPADARKGFEVLLSKLALVPDDAKSSDFSDIEKTIKQSDMQYVAAFITYEQQTCFKGDLPTAPPS